MNIHTLHVLEYHKIRTMLAEHARTPGGRERCLALAPFTTMPAARDAQQQTTDAEAELYRLGGSPLTSINDISECLARAALGGVLSPRDLLDCAAQLAVARNVKTSVKLEMAAALSPQKTLEDDIRAAIMGEDEISDHASAALADIRGNIRRTNQKIREKLESFLHSTRMRDNLQEILVTQRAGRYVLPVKASARGAVPGVVHDQSSSGQTVFIEPMAVVEMNNSIRKLESDEREEIYRILAEFSARIAMFGDALAANQEILYTLDFSFARAGLSREMKATEPVFGTGGLHFKQARHPLIPQDQIVPVDVWLGGSDTNGFTTLVITGPNTGGKTVSLKTVGLLSLMAASGLHIPCASESRACVFDEIFADIGDEQSIEQSLSTFSSHLRNIVGLLGKSGPSVLVLLDELGAGTDPAEGAALAISILEHLHNSGAMTVATTHYSEVKAYALTAQGIENASMEFDVASLRPTYRMSIGIPGQSNAFAIAARLGMPSVVLERAKALMTGEEIHFEQVISSAQEQKLLAEKELHAARRIHDEAVTAREKTVNLERELKQKQDKILEQARLQAQAVLQQAKAQADRALSAAKAAKSQLSAEAIEALRTEGKGLEKAILENAPAPPDDEDCEPLGKVELGQRVRIIGTQTYGEVAALPDSKGNVSVQTQLGRMQVPLKKLCAPGEADVLRQKKPKFSNTRTVPVSAQKKVESHEATVAARQAGLSLDIRGMNVDEALPRIDAFLDQARMNNLSEVTIIHGKGTGALRAGVQSYLKSLRGITSRPGNYGEGDAGVTVVEV